jgi:hypothetical protein
MAQSPNSLKSEEYIVLGVHASQGDLEQHFPDSLEELDRELSGVSGMPRPCAKCRREMGLLVQANPDILNF